MSCGNCSTQNGLPKGCKNNGTCGTNGCNKMAVFDWLSDITAVPAPGETEYVEVRFKNGRKEIFKNQNALPLKVGDIVAVQAKSGHDVGIVSIAGALVKVQMRSKKIKIDEDILKVYRIANQNDIDIWQSTREKENDAMIKTRDIASRLGLEMKVSDIEFQGDNTKVTIYFTAEDRVDFRQLIKDLATQFGVKIEMKQVSYRKEATRLGGIGSCGRELCCASWLVDFRSVSTSAARYQQLAINPQKLAGQCGKLKCCLNYELDQYTDALKTFPSQEEKLVTLNGKASLQKIDVFKRKVWYSYDGEFSPWVEINLDELIEAQSNLNKGEKLASLEDLQSTNENDISVLFSSESTEGKIDRFDRINANNKRRRKKKSRANNKPNTRNTENKKKPNSNTFNKKKDNTVNGQESKARNSRNKKRYKNAKTPKNSNTKTN